MRHWQLRLLVHISVLTIMLPDCLPRYALCRCLEAVPLPKQDDITDYRKFLLCKLLSGQPLNETGGLHGHVLSCARHAVSQQQCGVAAVVAATCTYDFDVPFIPAHDRYHRGRASTLCNLPSLRSGRLPAAVRRGCWSSCRRLGGAACTLRAGGAGGQW